MGQLGLASVADDRPDDNAQQPAALALAIAGSAAGLKPRRKLVTEHNRKQIAIGNKVERIS